MKVAIPLALLFFVLTFQALSDNSTKKVALIGKTKNISFYQVAFQGCVDYFKTVRGYECLYDGVMDKENPGAQTRIINKYIDKNVDALLVAATDTETVVRGALKRARDENIPVITFDADVSSRHEAFRLTYVGTNNFKFGKALGEAVKKHQKPGKNLICIQSGVASTPNLNDRIAGVRFALSGGEAISRLSEQNGWYEHEMCPLYSDGHSKRALQQLEKFLKKDEKLIFVAIAGFAQFDEDYHQIVSGYQYKLDRNDIILIFADAEPRQIKALEAGLSHANIGQNPYMMGYESARLMHEYLSKGQKPPKSAVHLDFIHCVSDKIAECSMAALRP